MCTVTYIPGGEGEFMLTTNRDEHATRSPKSITTQLLGHQKLVFPRDTLAGGTWVATSSTDRTVCLLNGAFGQHRRRPPYKRSRGLMVLDYFYYSNTRYFLDGYDFPGMEPFTMIIVEKGDLYELRWDGQLRHLLQHDCRSCYIWSSATLYEEAMQEKRRQWFRNWLEGREDFSREAVLDFHRNAGEGDPWNDVVMNRDGRVQTVSITNIVKQAGAIEMHYHDLLSEQVRQEKILLGGEVVGLR
jgi:hypothetical protein